MPKKLATLKKDLDDLVKRADPMLVTMNKRYSDLGTMGDTKGIILMIGEGLNVLDERLQKLGATSASDPKAAKDKDVQKLVAQINEMKANGRKRSDEYWTTATRVKAITVEANTLKQSIDAVIAEKNAYLFKSKSLGGLQTLSTDLGTYIKILTAATARRPKKSTHPILN